MSKIVHYEFMGNWFIFWILCILGLTIPFAILYLLDGTLRTETEVDNPEELVQSIRSSRGRTK